MLPTEGKEAISKNDEKILSTGVRVLQAKVSKSLGTCEKSSACQTGFRKCVRGVDPSRLEANRLGPEPKSDFEIYKT